MLMTPTISIPGLWIPRPRRIVNPFGWAMGHLVTKSHHLVKTTGHHLSKQCGANPCSECSSTPLNITVTTSGVSLCAICYNSPTGYKVISDGGYANGTFCLTQTSSPCVWAWTGSGVLLNQYALLDTTCSGAVAAAYTYFHYLLLRGSDWNLKAFFSTSSNPQSATSGNAIVFSALLHPAALDCGDPGTFTNSQTAACASGVASAAGWGGSAVATVGC